MPSTNISYALKATIQVSDLNFMTGSPTFKTTRSELQSTPSDQLQDTSLPKGEELRGEILNASLNRVTKILLKPSSIDTERIHESIEECIELLNAANSESFQIKALDLLEASSEFLDRHAEALTRAVPLGRASAAGIRHLLVDCRYEPQVPELQEVEGPPATRSLRFGDGLSALEHRDPSQRLSATLEVERLVRSNEIEVGDEILSSLGAGCFDSDERVFLASLRALSIAYEVSQIPPDILHEIATLVPFDRVTTVMKAVEWVENKVSEEVLEESGSESPWSVLKESIAQKQALLPAVGRAIFSSFVSNPFLGYGKQAAQTVESLNEFLCERSGFDSEQCRLEVYFSPLGKENAQGSTELADNVVLQASFIPILAGVRGEHPIPVKCFGQDRIEEALLKTIHELRHVQQAVFLSPSRNQAEFNRVSTDLNGLNVSLSEFAPEERKRIRLRALKGMAANLGLQHADTVTLSRERVAHYQLELDADIYSLQQLPVVMEKLGLPAPDMNRLIARIFGPESNEQVTQEFEQFAEDVRALE